MSLISSFTLRWAPKSGKDATTLYIRGTGYDRMAPSLVQINGVDLLSSSSVRGLHIVTINRDTLSKVDERNFDTYGNKYELLKTDYASISDIVSYLSSLDDSVFVCMCTYDAVYWPSSDSTMLECIGCTPIDISTERTPFACVGIKGLAPGYAIQIQSSVGSSAPYAELSTYIANRMFVSGKTNDDPLTILTDAPSVIVTANSSGISTEISGLSTIKGRFGNIIVSIQMFDATATKFHFDGSSNYASLSDMDNGFTLTSGNIKISVSDNGDGLSIGVTPASATAQCSSGVLIADLVIKYHNVTHTRTISIPIIINRKGDTGNDGIAGKDGVGISSTTITYQIGDSGTTEPTGTWSSTVPTAIPGKYLWTRTVWTYTDSTNETGYSVSKYGEKGDTGNDGIAGKDGVGIISTTITYQIGDSGTIAPTGTWSSSVPTSIAGKFLWTKMVWSYTDNTTETGYSVSKYGEKGDTGISGCQVRTTEWELGKEYRNDTDITDTSAVRYLDYVTVTSSTSYTAYLCKKTHTSSAAIGVSNTTYWTAVNAMAPISTPFISVQQALAKYIQANQLIVTDSNNVVQGAFGGGGDYLFWAGGATVDDATFKVHKNGKLSCTGANISGTINAESGIIRDVKLSGSIRNPFENSTGNFNLDLNDNVIVLGNGNEDALEANYTLPWTSDNNGRKIIIANYKYLTGTTTGSIVINAPEGKYFYMNSKAITSLYISKYGFVELLGIGDSSNFFGWLVLHKKYFSGGGIGIPMSALAFGSVITLQGTNGIECAMTCWSFDDRNLDVERIRTGDYKITVPSDWQNYFVIATGVKGLYSGASYVNACIADQQATYFEVNTHDDASLNDGSFNFVIYKFTAAFNHV